MLVVLLEERAIGAGTELLAVVGHPLLGIDTVYAASDSSSSRGDRASSELLRYQIDDARASAATPWSTTGPAATTCQQSLAS